MSQNQTHVDAAVGAVVLLRGVLQRDEFEGEREERGELAGDGVGELLVGVGEGVVGEGDTVDDGDQEERPVVAAGRRGGVGAVVDG